MAFSISSSRISIPWLFWLALRELWARRGRSLLSLLSLSLSVGLVVATGSIGALMQASVAVPAPLLGRPADLWVSSAYDVDYDLPASLAVQVEALPGVAGVQPVLRRPVTVRTPDADTLALLGVELASYFAFHDLTLAVGVFPSAESPGLVALAPWAFVRDLRLGSPVTLTTPIGDVALPVVGLVEVESLADAQQGLVLYAPLDTVAKLTGLQSAVTTLEVRLDPRAPLGRMRATLERALGPAYAISVASQPTPAPQLWQRLILGALLFVDVLTLVGSASLVYGVFAAATRSRRRQIGLLRAAGAGQGQVLALLVIEAALLGLAGGGLGLAAGFLFAQVGVRLVLHGAHIPTTPPTPVGVLPLAIALGVLGSLAGAIGPAMRATRQTPLAALRAVPHPAPSYGQGSRFRWSLPTRGLARVGTLGLVREWRRMVLVVGTLALILGMALGNVGVLSLLGEELAAAFGRLSGGEYLVLPGLMTLSLRELAGQDTSDVPPLSPGLLSALEALGGQVWLMAGTTADVDALQVFPGQPTLLLDVEGYARMGGFRFEAGDWPGAVEVFRREPAVLLAPVVARRLGVGLGDPVRLDTPHGPVDFRVAGIGDSEFTTCVLDLAQGATHLGVNEVNGVEIQVRPGADAEAVRRALLDVVRAHGGTLLSLDQVSAQLREMFQQARLAISLLIAVTGLVAGLGVVNAMLAAVAERSREIGLLRAVGATRQQIRQAILTEMATLGAAGALIGTVLGWAVTLVFLAVARTHLGLAIGDASRLATWLPLLIASGVGLALWPLLAALGGLIPAVYAARQPVIQALYEVTSSRYAA